VIIFEWTRGDRKKNRIDVVHNCGPHAGDGRAAFSATRFDTFVLARNVSIRYSCDVAFPRGISCGRAVAQTLRKVDERTRGILISRAGRPSSDA